MESDEIDWDKIIEWDKKYYLFPHRSLEEWEPFPVKKVEGAYLIDNKGRKFLDMSAGYISVNYGNRPPQVIEAIKKALDNFGFVTEYYTTPPRAEAAKLIIEDLLGTDGWAGKVHFLSSGSEAVEEAILVARLYRGGSIIVSRQWDYHGWTQGSGACTGYRGQRNVLSSLTGEVRELVRPEGYYLAPMPYCYRCPIGCEYSDCKKSSRLPCVKVLESMIRSLGTKNVAAVITTIVPGGGQVPPLEYFPQLREMTRELGVLWTDDEVMCGFGRTGKWFGYQHFKDVTPDLMPIAKGMVSSQLPAAGMVMSKEIASFLDECRWFHSSTYSAHPVAMAAVVANIKLMMEMNAPELAAKKGEYLGKRLRELQDKHECIGNVSGLGLVWTVEMVKNKETKEPFIKEYRDATYVGNISKDPGNIVSSKCLDKGVIVRSVLNEIRIGPSFIITEEEIDKGIEAFDYAFSVVDKMCDAGMRQPPRPF